MSKKSPETITLSLKSFKHIVDALSAGLSSGLNNHDENTIFIESIKNAGGIMNLRRKAHIDTHCNKQNDDKRPRIIVNYGIMHTV